MMDDPFCDVDVKPMRSGVAFTRKFVAGAALERFLWLPYTRSLIAQRGHDIASTRGMPASLAACVVPATLLPLRQ
jgi:hypothetical protein